MRTDPEYRSMLAMDVERSAGRGNVVMHEVHEALFAIAEESFGRSGIDWNSCDLKDLGDGLRVIVPASVSKNRLIHPLPHELSVRLRAHNRLAGERLRIRVRVAVHAGDVHFDDGRVSGRPLEVLARLLDAAPLREALSTAPDTVALALALSEHVHHEVVPHGYPGIDPDEFREVAFTVKETTANVWVKVFGSPVQVTPPVDSVKGEPAAHYAQYNTPAAHGVVYASQGGEQHFNFRSSE